MMSRLFSAKVHVVARKIQDQFTRLPRIDFGLWRKCHVLPEAERLTQERDWDKAKQKMSLKTLTCTQTYSIQAHI